jgi:chromosome segregation ATPase
VNNLLTQLLPVVSAVIGSGAFLAVFTDRRKRAAEAKKLGNEAGKADAEGQVALSGTTLAWARDFREEAAAARERAATAEAQAREANARADQCARDRDNDRERIGDLESQMASLLARIQGCGAGSTCPVAQSLRR